MLAVSPLIMIGFMMSGNEPTAYPVVYGDSLVQIDGPYVSYRNNQIFSVTFFDKDGVITPRIDSFPIAQKKDIILSVSTEEPGKNFSVHFKDNLENEKSTYKKEGKILVLSDMEGNFAAFRKLLLVNNVIDSSFNWTFGEGHVVLIGDFVDRGSQVTELLWLIYSLEDKAKAGCGYLHFVLGNHEIMDMTGDLRYLNSKYLQTITLLQMEYQKLFDENSELGRWLRTKNVIEKIGDVLFMHAGISAPMNRMDVSVQEINELARPYYADTTFIYPDPRVDTIFGDFGPFWYRGYYKGPNTADQSQVDKSLDKFNVKTIVIGHTIVEDTISTWFNRRVVNTDVHHASGKSEALLIEGKKFYRLTAKGEKIFLFER